MKATETTPSLLSKGTLSGLLRIVRPQQWYKQTLLFAGLIFSRNLFVSALLGEVVLGFFVFCGAAGSVYVFNDISDVEADRAHPSKQNRPIASGEVGFHLATGFGLLLFVFSLTASLLIGTAFFAVILLYLTQNTVYSTVLKNIAFADVITIAFGFVLRAIAGVVIISVPLSPWLIVSTFLLALLLALAKRYYELESLESPTTRKVFDTYSTELLQMFMVIVGTVLLVSFSMYTFFATNNFMLVTLPFVYFGIFRFFYLSLEEMVEPHPLSLLYDIPFSVNLIAWFGSVLAVLYFLPQRGI